MTKWLCIALGLVLLFVAFDHMMMVDQANMCRHGDRVPCPTGLWIWERL